MVPMLPRGASSLNGRADRGDRATTGMRTLLRRPHEPRVFARVFRETIVWAGKFLTKWLDMHTTSKPQEHIPPMAIRRQLMQMVGGMPLFARHKT